MTERQYTGVEIHYPVDSSDIVLADVDIADEVIAKIVAVEAVAER